MSAHNQANLQPIVPYYGIQLLDDLHNYFPAILYDHTSFRNVQDVLSYIYTRTHARFNLLSRAEESYNRRYTENNVQSRSVSPAQPRNSNIQRVQPRVQSRAQPRAQPRPSSSPPPVPYTPISVSRSSVASVDQQFTLPRRQNPVQESQSDTSELEEGEILQPQTTNNLANHILQLIGFDVNGFAQGPPLNGGLEYVYLTNLLMPRTNLEPVLVVPTQQDIEAGTTLLQAQASHESQNCSICQDSFTEGQGIRKFRVCQHEFHRTCIDVWFQRNVHCPVCRQDVRDNTVN